MRRQRQDAAVSEQAAPPAIRIPHLTELVADDAGDAVVAGEPFVHERVIGGEQIPHGPVFADDVAEEEVGFAEHRRLELLVEVRVEPHVGIDLVQVLQPQPLRGKARGEDVRAAIAEHPPDLLFEDGGRGQAARFRQLHEFFIGPRSPEEE